MISHHWIILCVLFFLFNTSWVVYARNLDVQNQRVFSSRSNSYFGYSLAAHESNSATNPGWLVGSPGENGFQGAVYKCDIVNASTNDFNCNKLLVEGPQDSWFGATVVSSKGSVLVCAPRASNENAKPENKEVDGRCYNSSDNLRSFTNYDLPNPRWICMSGFSAAFSTLKTKSGSLRPIIGAPTCLFPQKHHSRNPLPVTDNRLLFGVDKWDKWYFGYSMASGMFGGHESFQGEFILVTVAFHINSSFAGKVYLMEPNTRKELDNLTGYQPGEHFGASLAVSDLNGDGRDDIIIGAPHYTDYDSLKPEIGAVYIYYQTPNNTFERKFPEELLKGQASHGRFGYSVAALGDIDADGFNDLAVGAPYVDGGSGTVYVYRGSITGLSDRPSHIINGTSFNPPIKTFGFTMAAADFDRNGYSDLVVGAYESASIAYIPARPIGNISSHLTFITEEILLSKKECLQSTAENNKACSEIKFCLTYNGLGVPKTLQVNISLILDIDLEKDNRRFLFLENKSDVLIQTLVLEAASQKCLNKFFYVKPSIYENGLVRAKMTVEIIPPKNSSPLTLLPFFPTESIVNVVASINIVAETTSWWEYLASVLGAVLILAIIVGVLYKIGFFKRKLPPTEQAEGEKLTQDQAAAQNQAAT